MLTGKTPTERRTGCGVQSRQAPAGARRRKGERSARCPGCRLVPKLRVGYEFLHNIHYANLWFHVTAAPNGCSRGLRLLPQADIAPLGREKSGSAGRARLPADPPLARVQPLTAKAAHPCAMTAGAPPLHPMPDHRPARGRAERFAPSRTDTRARSGCLSLALQTRGPGAALMAKKPHGERGCHGRHGGQAGQARACSNPASWST